MTTTEGNKLIAEFMGGVRERSLDVSHVNIWKWHFRENKKSIFEDDLKYHSSWGWQIPAWSKAIQEYDLPRKSVYKTRYAVATAINDTMLGFKILIELITEINQNNQP